MYSRPTSLLISTRFTGLPTLLFTAVLISRILSRWLVFAPLVTGTCIVGAGATGAGAATIGSGTGAGIGAGTGTTGVGAEVGATATGVGTEIGAATGAGGTTGAGAGVETAAATGILKTGAGRELPKGKTGAGAPACLIGPWVILCATSFCSSAIRTETSPPPFVYKNTKSRSSFFSAGLS